MSMRTQRSACNDRIQRKRIAPGKFINERVYKYLKSMSNADCVTISPLDRPIDVPRQEHHERSGRSKSAPSVHRRRRQEGELDYPFLHTASEQGDTSLIDGGDKPAQAKGGCTKTQKPSSLRTSEPACNDKMQRKRSASESFIDERLHKYTKTASNLDPVSTSPTDRPIDLPSKEPRKPGRKSNSAPCGNQFRYREPDIGNPRASPESHHDLLRAREDLSQARACCAQVQTYSPVLNPPDTIRLPLSRQALSDLNKLNQSFSSGSSLSTFPEVPSVATEDTGLRDEPRGAINAYDEGYSAALQDKGIYFADAEEPDKDPSNIQALMTAVSATRTNYTDPDNNAARDLRIRMKKATNESETVQSVLPEIVPVRELQIENDVSTAPEQKWSRKAMIGPREKPMLTAPKPDRTIGWARHVFSKFPQARRYLGFAMCPAPKHELTIPLFTIEVKGDRGSLKVARLQNLHNGATMLYNLLRIREACPGKETDDFFNKVHAMSLELTADVVQLSCYWAARDGDGTINYYGRVTHVWTPYDGSHYKQAHRYIRNALEWVRGQALGWVCSALSALETQIKTNPSLLTTPHMSSSSASMERAMSMTSLNSSISSSLKKLGTNKLRNALSAAEEEAGDQEAEAEICTSEDVLAGMVLETGESAFPC